MKKLLIVISITGTLFSCKGKKDVEKKEANENTVTQMDSTLVTDSSWGPIMDNTSYETLKAIYGNANVKDERICGAECIDSIDVTFVHQGTPKEITIHWLDSFYHKKILMIETYTPGAPYRTASGLKVGSTLREVLKINGSKLVFSGFGWDYGGYIASYGEGSIGKSPIGIRLDFVEHAGADDMQGLYGDTELNTDMPAVQKNLDKIIVVSLTKSFINPVQSL